MSTARQYPGRQATAVLSRRAAAISAADLDGRVRDKLRMLVLDSFANCLLAHKYADQAALLCRTGVEMGGHGQSTILGTGERSTPAGASFVNGALVHGLNLDAYARHGGPIGIAALPASLALAEDGRRTTGMQLMSGVAAGVEVANRLAAAARFGRTKRGVGHAGGIEGQLLGYFAATASAGRVLGLSERQFHAAFGFALMQAAGSAQVMIQGDVPAKAFYGGFSAQGGVTSALLAAKGVDATCDALEGEAGLFVRHFPGASADKLVTDIDNTGFTDDILFKRWPLSSMTFPSVAAALDLHGRSDFDVGQVDTIRLRVEPRTLPWVEPHDARRNPETAAAASNSAFYAVAVALLYGEISPLHLAAPVRRDSRVLDLTARATYELADDPDDLSPALSIRLREPRRVLVSDGQRGRPRPTLTPAEVRSRFFETCAELAPGMPADLVTGTVAMIEDLESLDDCRRLGELLAALGRFVSAPGGGGIPGLPNLTERTTTDDKKEQIVVNTTQTRVSTVVSEIMDGIREVIVKHKVTYDEYAAAQRFLIALGESGEWPLFTDVFFESSVERVAFEDRDGSEGAIAGPYYVPGAPRLTSSDVLPMRPNEPGDVLIFSGSVMAADGTPLSDAEVEFWQSDAEGTYSNIPYPDARELPPEFNLRGCLGTDSTGRFEVQTVLPVPYEIPKEGPTGALLRAAGWHAFRPAHLHCRVQADGYQPLTTQLYFAGDPYLESDIASAVKESLVLELDKHTDVGEMGAQGLNVPFYTTSYEFRLAPA